MKTKAAVGIVLISLVSAVPARGSPSAESNFQVRLPPSPFAKALLPDSPFGINTAFDPDTPDLDDRLKAMQELGIKWGRQDFTWRRIEKVKGEYEWGPYDRLVEKCHQHGLLIFGDLVDPQGWRFAAVRSGGHGRADPQRPLAQVRVLRLRLDDADARRQTLRRGRVDYPPSSKDGVSLSLPRPNLG